MERPPEDPARPARLADLDTVEITALAHLYRAEVTRSTAWRTRLDTTTNWAVVTLGIALSIAFAAPNASPIPLVLVGILIVFFLMLEARRYRYYNVWRARTRWMETRFFAPLLLDEPLGSNTRSMLAQDHVTPKYHVSLLVAVGRRVRSNYLWILFIQTVAYIGKLLVHPVPAVNLPTFIGRADVGPIPGEVMLGLGAAYVLSWTALAVWGHYHDKRRRQKHDGSVPLSFG